MDKNDYIELIHSHISGEISPEGLARLEKYLRENDEAGRLYLELLETSRLLDSVRDVEPSPNIKKRIMNSVDPGKYRPQPARESRGSLLDRIWTPRLKLAYVFTFGIVIGIVIYSQFAGNVAPQQPIDIGYLYGTIGIIDRNGLVPVHVEDVEIDLANVTGRADLYQSDGILVLTSDLSAMSDVEFQIEFDASQLTFGGTRPEENTRVWIEHGRGILLASTSGRAQYLFSVREGQPADARLVMKLIQSGNVIFEHRFEPVVVE